MKVGIGEDSHRFEKENSKKPCILGGVVFADVPGLLANSDGDVVLHAITNAISGVTCHNILGAVADKMCKEDGIGDSAEYLRVALDDLEAMNISIEHLSISIECARPKISPMIPEMRESISSLLGIEPMQVGITATSGEELTEFGRGNGIAVRAIITVD